MIYRVNNERSVNLREIRVSLGGLGHECYDVVAIWKHMIEQRPDHGSGAEDFVRLGSYRTIEEARAALEAISELWEQSEAS